MYNSLIIKEITMAKSRLKNLFPNKKSLCIMFLLNMQEDDMFQKMKQIIYYNADIRIAKVPVCFKK